MTAPLLGANMTRRRTGLDTMLFIQKQIALICLIPGKEHVGPMGGELLVNPAIQKI